MHTLICTQTLEIRRRALEQVRAARSTNGNSTATASAASNKSNKKKEKGSSKVKEDEDPEFLSAVKEIVYAMEIKGGYRKWEWGDAAAVKLFWLPINLVKFIHFNAKWYYNHSIRKLPLTKDEEEYLTIRKLGQSKWEMIDDEDERRELVGLKIWEDEAFDFAEWREKKEMAKMPPNVLKKYLKQRRRAAAASADSYSDEE